MNQNFTGVGRTSEVHNGRTYWTYDTAPYERWVDIDNDGFIDYGLRDEGQGHRSKFEGFQWKDSKGNPMPDSNYDPPVGGGIARGTASHDQDFQASIIGTDDGWFF